MQMPNAPTLPSLTHPATIHPMEEPEMPSALWCAPDGSEQVCLLALKVRKDRHFYLLLVQGQTVPPFCRLNYNLHQIIHCVYVYALAQ